ncbi:MAG: hypothetical protein V5804_14110 [Mucilaginibacter sp.]|uniref:hypothetical protein n=1 Tax=Mucilaginibacter sp. TaxID=1882438 RepID=UPI0034E41D61
MNTITIRKKLESATIKLGKEAEALVGKNVEIIIREVTDKKPTERKWTTIGSVSIGTESDKINIRDFAYED